MTCASVVLNKIECFSAEGGSVTRRAVVWVPTNTINGTLRAQVGSSQMDSN